MESSRSTVYVTSAEQYRVRALNRMWIKAWTADLRDANMIASYPQEEKAVREHPRDLSEALKRFYECSK